MAMGNLKLTPATGFARQLRSNVTRGVSDKWVGRTAAMSVDIKQEIGSFLAATLETSSVAKALRGHGSEDLPAHFGLNNAMANSLVDGMTAMIRQSVLLSIKQSKYKASIRIRAGNRVWTEYLHLPGAEYISHPSNIAIPVLKWLLMDPNIDVGQAAYDIVFLGEQGKSQDTRIQSVSRSGRAIMVSLDNLGGSGGYVLPAIVSGKAGENFIEYTLGQPNVAHRMAQIVMRRVG